MGAEVLKNSTEYAAFGFPTSSDEQSGDGFSGLHADAYAFPLLAFQTQSGNFEAQTVSTDAQIVSTEPPAGSNEARTKLENSLNEQFTKDKVRARFRAEMDAFESRVQRDNLKPEQITQTYEEIARLMAKDEKSTIPLERRVQLAQQVLRQASYPPIIDQGRHNTCIANALEVRAYTRSPEKAAKLVADLALNNSFRTLDNTEISLDAGSMTPDEEADEAIPANGQRSFASQLFAIAANNVYWLRTEIGAFNEPVTKGSYRFSQAPNWRGTRFGPEAERMFDFGERVIDMRTKPLKWVADRPALPVESIEDMYAQITGDTAGGFVITAKNKEFNLSQPVESADQLKERVVKLKEDRLMPAVLIVNTNNEPWNNYPGIWHAINILDYNAEKDRLSVSDQYGKESDKNMKARDLFNAARGPSGRVPPTLPGSMSPR